MAKNDLARRAQEMTAGLFGPSLPELQAGADQEGRRGGADQEERQAARKERRKESPAGSGRMCLNIREAFRENRGGMEGTGEPPGLGISRDKQGRRANYHVNLKRA